MRDSFLYLLKTGVFSESGIPTPADSPAVTSDHTKSPPVRRPLPPFRGQCSIILGDPSKATTTEFWKRAAEQTERKLRDKGFEFSYDIPYKYHFGIPRYADLLRYDRLIDSVTTKDMAKLVCSCECMTSHVISSNDATNSSSGTSRRSPSPTSADCGGLLEIFC